MASSIVVIVQEDPQKSPKPVEALRIALGLSSGENPLTIILRGNSPFLLGEGMEEAQDSEILEKYLPSIKQLEIPFVVPIGGKAKWDLNPEFSVREMSETEMASCIASADRILAF